MGLRRNEDHGTDLLAELEDFVASHQQRVADRRTTVRSRLAALEAEHADLDRTNSKLESIKS